MNTIAPLSKHRMKKPSSTSRQKKEKAIQKDVFLSFIFDELAEASLMSMKMAENGVTEADANSTAVQGTLDIPPLVAPSPLFAATLYSLSSVSGLGHKGIAALDKDFGLAKLWETESSLINASLMRAKVTSAGSITKIISDDPDELLERGRQKAEQMAQERHIHVIAGEHLPESLRQLPDAPRWLFVEGNTNSLYSLIAIALVGTRTPSDDGVKATSIISDVLAPYPITIVSGLAEGIDEEAHYATLQKRMTNIAFLGHGVNYEFPAKTVYLRRQILDQGGAVVSEYLPDEKYQKSFFVQRNRLQAGLASVVVPVEATVDGGTAHTVRFAAKYSRPLFGIRWPGANGILSQLEHDGTPIFDVFTLQGRQALDGAVRQLIEEKGGDAYPLKLLEKRVKNEFDKRNVHPNDVMRFIKALMESVPEDI